MDSKLFDLLVKDSRIDDIPLIYVTRIFGLLKELWIENNYERRY